LSFVVRAADHTTDGMGKKPGPSNLRDYASPRFAGTCYQAAGWQELGRTTGRGKADQAKKPNRSIKAVWGYPLHPEFRRLLATGQIEHG
jgi:hypothetical protein